MRKIDKEARRLLERVLKRYYAASEWSRKALSLMIDDELARYNKRVQKIMEPLIYKHLKDHFPTHALPPVVPTPPELSQMLYRNARQAAGQAVGLLWSAQKAGKGIRDLTLELYEGYGFRDKEVLGVVKGLPLYLRRQLKKPTVQKRVVKQVSRLRTRPLRAAYADIVRAVESENRVALQKAAKVAIEEKSRYYARRIAVTEEMRAFNLANAKEMLQDDEIELVRYTMSSAHPMMDICDYYANLDVGYGRGVVPKREMVSLPLHPHCRCKYEPYYRDVKRKSVRNPSRKTLERFSENQQRQILGSWEAWKKWREGTSVESIFNASRPKYPISPVIQVLSAAVGVKDVLKKMLQFARAVEKLRHTFPAKIAVGVLSAEVLAVLERHAIPVHSEEIYLNHKGITHLSRASKRQRGAGLSDEDILKIPEIIEDWDVLVIEKANGKNVLWFCRKVGDNRYIKVVVDTKFIRKGKKESLILTAGYISKDDIKNPHYEVIDRGR